MSKEYSVLGYYSDNGGQRACHSVKAESADEAETAVLEMCDASTDWQGFVAVATLPGNVNCMTSFSHIRDVSDLSEEDGSRQT